MGFVHRPPNSAGSCKRWPDRVEPPQVCPGSDRIPALPKGGAFFVCLNSSLPPRLAPCSLRQLPVRNAQNSRCFSHPTLFHRRTCPRSHHFRLVVPPSRLPAGSKTDASFEALVSPEHYALALTGSRLGELAPTLTIEFQDNAARRFAWRPEDGRLDLHPAAALPAQP